ncbi:PhaM family polyhydroxyalkanoate granule multifunctional regulatory protein [Roseateles sp. DC23W]|uniref:PhaM family polyhydroxyalkanoate granule multifunctional regulatory protein n=1 Tax=Pelomonas dachongensis TaxID=3299029 RepID=A0ABW7EHB6_9BURK
MTDNSFTKLVPGFDFLQGLVKNAGSALPGIGQWVAPTLNPEELEKRIEELRTVQFWLEQNARMLAATIQALEVQRMTLSTLQTMNVPLAQLRDTLKLPEVPAWPAEPPPAAQAASKTVTRTVKAATQTAADAAKAAAANPAAAIDPTQWWSALSQQFTQLAATAMKDTATDAAKNLAGSLVKQSFDAASDTLRKAATMPSAVVGSVAKGFAAGAAKTTASARKRTAAPALKSPASKAPKAAAKTASAVRRKA